ncbi:hypothetical protein AB0F72_27725 [Actinoplanes sp. NPDC023936]|uniref:hypothetical protein n=1 Tax=Actinoplanes sp. NPDC023936 TaxID=3154910 RepID=UPI0034086E43
MSVGLRRHLEARGAAATLLAVSVAALAMAYSAGWFKDGDFAPGWWWPIVTAGPLLAVTFVARTLAGADVALERSTARQRPALRAAHVVAGLLVAVVPPALAGLAALGTDATVVVVRNSIGLLGLVLLASGVMRAGTSWMPALGYTVFVLASPPRQEHGAALWWGWPMQPGDIAVPWTIAVVLLVAGAAAYLRRGPAL